MANLRKCLLEIKERLGPLTKELGLRHRLSMDGDEFRLFFERKDNNGVVWKAPVIFTFPPASTRQEIDDTWSKVRIRFTEAVAKPVGTNGWVCFDGPDYELTIGQQNNQIPSIDIAFEAAESTLREFPLMPDDMVSGVIEVGPLDDIWQTLRSICSDHGVEEIDVDRTGNGDEFFCLEYDGSAIEIVFSGDKAKFLVDGEVESVVQSYRLREMELDIRWMFDVVERRRRPEA